MKCQMCGEEKDTVKIRFLADPDQKGKSIKTNLCDEDYEEWRGLGKDGKRDFLEELED
ncbi:MAG: hypothetical protein SV377_02685 [Halobacteria archaeon]|nr:hypothetical protein [Halobacteria archaeon]